MGAQSFKKGVVFDIKKCAVDDGPGIRTTIFLKGCPLRCSWCHNPEGQSSAPELMYRHSRCNQCGDCAECCPKDAISSSVDKISIDRKLCTVCDKCSETCVTDALTIVGKEVTVDDVVKEIDKDLIFYEESGGGITISGGEPLLQLDFLNELLEECRRNNIHTAVDTCGYASHEAIDKISDKVDLFLFDIKTMSDKVHRKYTGVSNKLILENFRRLADNGNDLLVRFPVIPGINDGKDNVAETAEFVVSCGVKQISLLPYHRAGIEKYEGLGRAYRLKSIQTLSNRALKSIKQSLETFGLAVTVGGG